ncbi:hypothetical protein [Leisingera thetidis]|uniref:hypothetical protein n=1 Tax=Leisingera thetidis TaxID=2930199 RepID=UPI003D9CA1E8
MGCRRTNPSLQRLCAGLEHRPAVAKARKAKGLGATILGVGGFHPDQGGLAVNVPNCRSRSVARRPAAITGSGCT